MGKTGLEMMLDAPEVLEAHFLGQFDLSQHFVEGLKFGPAILDRVGNLNLVKYGEVHHGLL